MDRPLLPCLWLGLSLFTTCIFADELAGAAEYGVALETGEQFAALAEELIAVSDAQVAQLSEAAKAQKREQAVELALKYPQQMKASADLGFAPAQFMYGKMLALKALGDKAQRVTYNAQACELMNKAADSGLFIAALGQSQVCSRVSAALDTATFISAANDRYRRLLEGATRADPYAAYYPLKPLNMPQCFELEDNAQDQNLTPLQRLQATQPPELTLEEARAEGFYQLAQHETPGEKALATEHITQAAALGCTSKAFAAAQAALQRTDPQE